MIKTYDVPRGSGKTTKVCELLKEDQSLYCIVPLNHFKRNFPEGYEKRIIAVGMDLENLQGKDIKKVVLDEGFMYKKDTLAKLYYLLGSKGIDVVAYGTVE